eukprot:3820463-Amphidinium_carterae.1
MFGNGKGNLTGEGTKLTALAHNNKLPNGLLCLFLGVFCAECSVKKELCRNQACPDGISLNDFSPLILPTMQRVVGKYSSTNMYRLSRHEGRLYSHI